MQITHDEARRLIDFRSDLVLDADNSITLSLHLKACADCSAYADQINAAEKVLQTVMKKHWNALPLPQNRQAILAKVALTKWSISKLLPARLTLIGATLLLFGFVLWQFGITDNTLNGGMSVNPSQIPTPATVLLTSTQKDESYCQTTPYDVQEDENLDDIAQKFSTTRESIIELNKLESESIMPGSRLLIQVCNLTPTGTVNAPTFTITPILQSTTNMPG